jgi:hypothetical protein
MSSPCFHPSFDIFALELVRTSFVPRSYLVRMKYEENTNLLRIWYNVDLDLWSCGDFGKKEV